MYISNHSKSKLINEMNKMGETQRREPKKSNKISKSHHFKSNQSTDIHFSMKSELKKHNVRPKSRKKHIPEQKQNNI